MPGAYKKVTTYTFKVEDVTWEIREAEPGYVYFYEVSDESNVHGEAYKDGDTWLLMPYTLKLVKTFHGSKVVNALEEFFNQNEPPTSLE